MSKIFKMLALTLFSASLMFFFACSDDDDGDGNGTGPTNGDQYMTADISGDAEESSFEATNFQYASQGLATMAAGFEGQLGSSSNISITSADLGSADGTLDIATGQVTVGYTEYAGATDFTAYTATSGEVEITSNTADVIEGTFNFEGTGTDGGSISVTNGKFKIQK